MRRLERQVLEALGEGQLPIGDEQLHLRGLPDQLFDRAMAGEPVACAKCQAALWQYRCSRLAERPKRPLRTRSRAIVGGSVVEQWHADLVSESVGKSAGECRDVLEFRAWLFGVPAAPVLSAPEALALLGSPLLRYASKEDLDSSGIPLIGHEAKILNGPSTPDHKSQPSKSASSKEVVEVLVSWPGGRKQFKFGWVLPKPSFPFIEFPGERGETVSVEVWLSSVLGTIQLTAEKLTQPGGPCTPWWIAPAGAAPAAVWYLLTGATPTLPAIGVTWEVPGSGVEVITINAFNHASPNSVKAAFAKAQKRQSGGHVPPPRRLALLHFVASQTSAEGKRAPWSQLWLEWNRTAPAGWKYKRWRNMCRDFEMQKDQNEGTADGLTYAERVLVELEAEIRARRA